MRNAMLVVMLIVLAVACGGNQVVTEPPSELEYAPALLNRADGLFVYRTLNERPPARSRHRVHLDEFTIEVTTPRGWSSSAVGNAAWIAHDGSNARFVIYSPEPRVTHLERIRQAHEQDSQVRDVVIGNVLHIDSDRQPYIYVINQRSFRRIRLGYAFLAEPGNPESGILTTGTWPSELHDQLAPVVVDAINSIQLTRR